ncbi:MAG TPA: hypothetical protein VFJ16_09590 [Longimicrobium sp.]|nr:hypothetical protein [Longimicrobium sp.]
MRKMKLDIDELRVETFSPQARAGSGEGTVVAHYVETLNHAYSCDIESCGGTCIITYIACGTCGNDTDVDLC